MTSAVEFEIKLRAPEPEDVELLYLWENDHEIWQISNTFSPFSKYILEKYIETAQMDIYETKQLRLMIDLLIDNGFTSQTIGTIDMFDFDPYHGRAGIGILIGDKSNRKRGYADAALKKFIEYGFNVLHLHQLYCNIGVTNTDSLKLFENNGFILTGRKTDWLRTSGKYTDELLLQLINPIDATNS